MLTPAQETVDGMIGRILEDEGEQFVDRPDDAGGPTQCGVSLRFAKSVKLDLNHDGVTDAEDIRLVTPEIARSLFLRYFYQAPHINTLPASIQPMMFDEAVNFGAAQAIGCLQRAILCPVDGRVGDLTRATLEGAINRVGIAAVTDRTVNEFITEYRRIAAANPKEEANLVGWENRANRWRV